MHSQATLLFVRHAAAQTMLNGHALLCGSYDPPLSPEGCRQVTGVRRLLEGESQLNAMYVSPLRRAVQTAAAAPERLRASIRILRSLAEIDCGTLDGMPISEVKHQYRELWLQNEAQQDENFSWPGGETYVYFRRRVLRAVNTIARAHGGNKVLIVTHAGVINQVLGTIAGQSAARWETPRPRNASVTRVLWGSGGGSVVSFDDCSHLEDGVLV